MWLRLMIGTLLFLGAQTPAWALFEAHGLVGRRWNETEDAAGEKQGVRSDLLGVDAYFTLPLPILTLGFGPGIEYSMYNEGDLGLSSVDSATATKISAKVLAGIALPLTGLDVYGKLGYSLWSSAETKGQVLGVDVKQTNKIEGTSISLGLRYSLVPLVGLLLEANFAQEKFTENETNGAKSDDVDSPSTAVLLGINVGI